MDTTSGGGVNATSRGGVNATSLGGANATAERNQPQRHQVHRNQDRACALRRVASLNAVGHLQVVAREGSVAAAPRSRRYRAGGVTSAGEGREDQAYGKAATGLPVSP